MGSKKESARPSASGLLAAGPAIGVAFSLIGSLSLGGAARGPIALLVAAAYGAMVGLLITGTCFALYAVFPALVSRRVPRILAVFASATGLHIGVSAAIAYLTGVRASGMLDRGYLGIAGLVGLVSAVAGEAIHNVQMAEEAADAEARAVAAALAAKESAETAIAMADASFAMSDEFAARYELTAREREIADLLVAKRSYAEIADRLFISMPTVKSHASAIYAKTDTVGRRELVALVSATPRG